LIDIDIGSKQIASRPRRRPGRAGAIFAMAVLCGCATIRVTDPPRTADEEFLENVATQLAVDKLSASVLRDRIVYIDPEYLSGGYVNHPFFPGVNGGVANSNPSDEQQYLLGELRAKLLLSGVRLAQTRKEAQIVLEVRSQGISINHIEFLLGLNSTSIGGVLTGGLAATTPELSIIKRTTQQGFASVAYIAYWADTGEVVASSGPFVGRTERKDYWFFGYGPETTGNIPPAQEEPSETGKK
jgi:hypothetical protein